MKTKILVILILLIVIGFTGWRISKLFQNKDSSSTSNTEQKMAPAINGSMVPEELTSLRPIAAVIENHSDSRPQSGLTDADIVYETLAEGGITRFLAIFQTRQTKEVGPIRSARPYFNFLSNLWSASMVHSGGSKQALSELSSGVYKNLFDINEFYYGDYFTRDKSRQAPHNLYTNIEEQRQLLLKKNESSWNKISMWESKATPTSELRAEINKINIPFSTPSYEAQFTFDPSTSSYRRTIGGKPAIDKNNGHTVSTRNVLVMLTDISPVAGDELGTQNIKLDGSGPCYLFSAGRFTPCKWNYQNNKHVYINNEGQPLTLEPGQTWIAIFPRDRQNEVKWE